MKGQLWKRHLYGYDELEFNRHRVFVILPIRIDHCALLSCTFKISLRTVHHELKSKVNREKDYDSDVLNPILRAFAYTRVYSQLWNRHSSLCVIVMYLISTPLSLSFYKWTFSDTLTLFLEETIISFGLYKLYSCLLSICTALSSQSGSRMMLLKI